MESRPSDLASRTGPGDRHGATVPRGNHPAGPSVSPRQRMITAEGSAVTTRGDQDQMLKIASTPVSGEWPELAPRSALIDVASLDGALQGSAAERLRLPGALAVTTGQQPGLFGGPMYVLHKALGARALAKALELRWQRPVVPVFWLAGDDHDWDEAT